MALTELDFSPSSEFEQWDEEECIRLVNFMYREARKEKRKYKNAWNRYEKLVRNLHWSEFRATWLPRPQASEIYAALHLMIAWMTDQRASIITAPVPDVPPLDPEEIKTKGKDFQETFDSWWWLYSDNQSQIEMALWDALKCGTGVMYVGWDSGQDNGLGQPQFRRVDSWSLLIDPMATSFEDARYVGEVRETSMVEIYQRFPERADEVEPSKKSSDLDKRPKVTDGPGYMAQGNTENLAATNRVGAFPGTSSPGQAALWSSPNGSSLSARYQETCLLQEFWVKEVVTVDTPDIDEDGKVDTIPQEVIRWRYIAKAGDTILNEDQSNPFEHGQLPYVRIPTSEIGEFWSIPIVEHLAPVQIALNRLLAAAQLNVEITGNPILVEPKGGGTERIKVVAKPGQRLPVNAGAAAQLRWLNPPTMQVMVMQLIQFWQSQIDRITGMSSAARGGNMRRREPAQAVDAVQEASFVRIRAIIRNLEEALRNAGEMVARNITQFYIEPRTIPLIGPAGANGFKPLGPRHFTYTTITGEKAPLNFRVWVQAGSTLPLSRQQRSAEYDALFAMGAVSVEEVRVAHNIPNAKELPPQTQQPQANPRPKKR